jgi:hypothetical protein
MNRFNISSNLAACNTYRRFLRTPTIIAAVLVMVSWVVMSGYTFIYLQGMSHPLLELVVFLILSVVCYPVMLYYVFSEVHSAMIKRRLWMWGKDKFNSWDEFSDWIGRTHHLVLDHIAGLPDDSWYPDTKRGGMEK